MDRKNSHLPKVLVRCCLIKLCTGLTGQNMLPCCDFRILQLFNEPSVFSAANFYQQFSQRSYIWIFVTSDSVLFWEGNGIDLKSFITLSHNQKPFRIEKIKKIIKALHCDVTRLGGRWEFDGEGSVENSEK